MFLAQGFRVARESLSRRLGQRADILPKAAFVAGQARKPLEHSPVGSRMQHPSQ